MNNILASPLSKFKDKVYLKYLRLVDKLNGTDFYSYDKTDSPEANGLDPDLIYRSTPSGFHHLRSIIKRNLLSRENIIDIGCGKGSAMKLFADLGFKSVAGVEINNRVATIAKQNFRKRQNVTVYNADAIKFLEYGKYKNFYFYNPFPCDVFDKIIGQIYEKTEGEIHIIYANDSCKKSLIDRGFILIDKTKDMWDNYISVWSFSKK